MSDGRTEISEADVLNECGDLVFDSAVRRSMTMSDETDALSDQGADDEAAFYEAQRRGIVNYSEDWNLKAKITLSIREQAPLMEAAYERAAAAKVGDTIQCPGCGRNHVKTTYHNKFCTPKKKQKKRKNKCKDRYHNIVEEKILRIIGDDDE